LQKRGLIVRVQLKRDRRAYRLQLTATGRAMLQRLTECADRHERNLDRVIGRRERGQFLTILKRVIAEL
jgi:DNA-binding MarR family transcriptional regulator